MNINPFSHQARFYHYPAKGIEWYRLMGSKVGDSRANGSSKLVGESLKIEREPESGAAPFAQHLGFHVDFEGRQASQEKGNTRIYRGLPHSCSL